MENLTGAPLRWRDQLLETTAEIVRVLGRVRRVAVIGIKPEVVGGPAFSVPERMQQVGYEIVPIPVYYPDITEILGVPIHRSLSTVSPAVDMVVLFRRPNDVPLHLDDILAHRPSVVWMQLGIRHDGVAQQLAEAGIAVIQDRCVKVELERMRGPRL
jgi:predicted CoA-binding protein